MSGSKGLTTLTGLVNLHIQNPFADREMDAVRITIDLEATIRMNIMPDFKITGKVHDLKTKMHDFKAFFWTYATKESLDSQLSFLDPWAISYINNLLNEGLELPLPEWIITPMTKPRFKQYDGYWLFDSEPKTQTDIAATDVFLQ